MPECIDEKRKMMEWDPWHDISISPTGPWVLKLPSACIIARRDPQMGTRTACADTLPVPVQAVNFVDIELETKFSNGGTPEVVVPWSLACM